MILTLYLLLQNERYKYKSKLDIHNGAQLKGHFQTQKSAMGLQIKDLKDGWSNVAEDITKMEEKKEVLVRRAKDGVPKTVWANDPSLMLPMDPVFAKAWHSVQVPDNPDELRKVLLANKMTAATQAKVIVAAPTTKKKKGPRRGGKQTNTHMIGILKDFSGMRK